MVRFRNLFVLLFQWMVEKLCLLGSLVDSPTGLLIFTITGICLNAPLSTLEPKSMNAQPVTLGTLRLSNWPMSNIFPPLQVASAEYLSRLDRKLDANDPGTCPHEMAVVPPPPGIQWSSVSTDSEGSVNKPSDTCLELQPLSEALHSTSAPLCKHTNKYENNCEIKQSDNLMITRLPSSCPTELKDESPQLCDKQGGISVMLNSEVNGSLIQRSKSRLKSWCSYIKNHLCNSTSCDRLEKIHQLATMSYAFSLKYNFLSLLSLFLLLADGMFGLMKRPYIGVSVAVIIVLGVGISGFLTRNNGPLASPFQYDFATLIYGIARSLMFLSLILKQTQREWLSHLMAGLACAWLTLGVLCYSIHSLPLEYACVGVSVLFFFVLFTICYGFTPERVD